MPMLIPTMVRLPATQGHLLPHLPGWLAALLSVLLSACAGYSGSGLVPGEARLPDVVASMGEPALRWQGADGTIQLAYPCGPEAPHTFMAYIGSDGRLLHIENVLVERTFARIVADATAEEVLRLIGPPQPHWVADFPARAERVWEWRYCDGGNQMALFNVIFDSATMRVRGTSSRPDYRGPDGGVLPCAQVFGR